MILNIFNLSFRPLGLNIIFVPGMEEPSLKRLRRANAVYFFISGFGYSSWTSRIPGIKESLKLNDAHFGTLLFMMPVGLILTMPFTGKLLDHYKSRTIMLIGTIMYNWFWHLWDSAAIHGCWESFYFYLVHPETS